MAQVVATRAIIGMEVHVELAARSKVFCAAPSPAAWPEPDATDGEEAGPNTMVDHLTMGLPGSLPTLNGRAVRDAVAVGLALGCQINRRTRWDRKSYFYPDMPKNYQISQHQEPLCVGGRVEVPTLRADGLCDPSAPPTGRWVRVRRAHLEEDAGKLLHEAPGGSAIGCSILDLNRAGTALLEIVTEPDLTSAQDAVALGTWLRDVCRGLGVTRGVLQRGHMRFEPNINTELTLSDGRTVRTPVVEVKNLNSLRAVRGAIEHELREQPRRLAADGLVMRPGAKTTRGWDERSAATVLQREKEEAADYRYFPDPDLPPAELSAAWVEGVRASVGELPLEWSRRAVRQLGLSGVEAAQLGPEPGLRGLFEAAVAHATGLGCPAERAARAVAVATLQSLARRANAQTAARHEKLGSGAAPVGAWELGLSGAQVGDVAAMREAGELSAQNADALLGLLCQGEHRGADARRLAQERGLLSHRDQDAMAQWVTRAIQEHPAAAADVRAGKEAALGRLVGAVMKLSGGTADGAQARDALLAALR
ncbi:MAG: Asp-tRNA(Asn)/Glu-tRNA(Gln) amidotransferase GatCAB subunit B [Planctomyces sp.]|nr:Asp-tRNA(Asn)/Glu-tRNA(Gln) amidotransferase GatCAB subunit B [Planctomyces sp.]